MLIFFFQNIHVSYFQLACYVDRKCFLKNTKKQRNVFSLMAKRKMDSHWKLNDGEKRNKGNFCQATDDNKRGRKEEEKREIRPESSTMVGGGLQSERQTVSRLSRPSLHL